MIPSFPSLWFVLLGADLRTIEGERLHADVDAEAAERQQHQQERDTAVQGHARAAGGASAGTWAGDGMASEPLSSLPLPGGGWAQTCT